MTSVVLDTVQWGYVLSFCNLNKIQARSKLGTTVMNLILLQFKFTMHCSTRITLQ